MSIRDHYNLYHSDFSPLFAELFFIKYGYLYNSYGTINFLSKYTFLHTVGKINVWILIFVSMLHVIVNIYFSHGTIKKNIAWIYKHKWYDPLISIKAYSVNLNYWVSKTYIYINKYSHMNRFFSQKKYSHMIFFFYL